MRAAIYARFSSELQNPKSADDQLAECKAYVERQGGTVVLEFKDEGISGASVENRPQLQALLSNAGNGVFDAVVVEAFDRLSRSMGDTDRIQKLLAFHKVKLISVQDGEANTLLIGMRGISAASFLDDLRQKTKRGQLGALKRGKIAGGRCYGYDVVPGEKGERTINDEQAAVVRRIFSAYADGLSADEIARALNGEGVPSPRGQAWRVNTLLGGTKDNTGLLRNELYRGVFVFGRHEYVKSPDSGRRLARHVDRSQWLRQPMPELRIISDDIWDRVQSRLSERSVTHKAAVAAKQMTRKPPRLLSGLLRCGCCGEALHIVRDDRAQCVGARSGTCSNTRMVSMADIETRVISAVRERLLSPALVERAINAARGEMTRLREEENRARRALEKELQDVNRELQGMLKLLKAYISRDEEPPQTILDDMRTAEQRKAGIELALAEAPEQKVELHPSAPTRYRYMVDQLWSSIRRSEDALPGREISFRHGRAYEHEGSRKRYSETALQDEAGQAEARQKARDALRALIEYVVVTPDGPPKDKRGCGPVALTVHGQLAAILADNGRTDSVHRVALVAGIGFEPMTFRL